MFRYTQKMQVIADKTAKEHNRYAAEYIGTYHEYGVFEEMNIDSRIRCEGAPAFMLMDDTGATKYVCNFNSTYMGSFDIIDHLKKHTGRRKGESLYKNLMRKLEIGDYSHESKEYLEYLQFLDLENWNKEEHNMLPIDSVYAWLLAAHRNNDEIAVFKELHTYSDGTEYSYFVAIRDLFIRTEEHIEKEYKIPRDWEMVVKPETNDRVTQEILLSPEALEKRRRLVELRSNLAEMFEKRDYMVSQEKPRLTAQYIELIGKLQYEAYALNVDVMKLKRKHQLIQSSLNRGERPDMQLVEQTLEVEFMEYQQQIEAQAENLRAAKSYLEAPLISEEDVTDMVRIYRIIVKRLHPDWNPDLSEEKKELFVRAQAAYKSTDVQELRNILLMLDAEEPPQIKEDTIDDDIARLERSLEDLRSRVDKLNESFPFDHREKLNDKEWIERKQADIKASIEMLTEEKRRWELFIFTQTGAQIGQA